MSSEDSVRQGGSAPGLDALPRHWAVVPVKREFEVRLGKMLQSTPSSPTDIIRPYLRAINIQPSGLNLDDVREMWFRPDEFVQLRLREGDLLVSEGGDVGRSAVVGDQMPQVAIQNAINRVRSYGNSSTSFLHYWLQVAKGAGFIDVLCNRSTIPHFTAEKLSELRMPLPPLEEQRSIAAFLDHETERIDELVREQQRLLGQATERFASRLAAALTRGVRESPDVLTTDVPWLPLIKSDWQLVPFKRLVVLQRGFDLPQQDRVNGTVPVVSSGGVIDTHNVAAVKGPGIITGRYGTIGEVAFVDDDYWPLNTSLFSREFHGNSLRFAYHVLRWLKPQVESLSAKSAVSGVDRNDLHRLLIALPPLEEQCEIAAFLDKSLDEVEKLSASLKGLEALLTERRTALITAAVTGQIDLRDWRPPESEPATLEEVV